MDIVLWDNDALDAKLGKKSASQRQRNIRDHKMPKPIKVGYRNAWIAKEIDAYLRVEIAKRDHPHLANALSKAIKDSIRAGENPWSDEWVEERLASLKAQRAKTNA